MIMKQVHTFVSSDTKTNISYYIYTPDAAPKAIVQISHGMCEYAERYEAFAEFLCEHGILVCAHDHLGHGAAARELGFFADKGGSGYLVDDIYKLNDIIKKKYPDTPCIILGHSMGSFIVRAYMARYPDSADAVILSGTSGKNPLNVVGIGFAKFLKRFCGAKHRSKLLTRMAFFRYNRGFEKVGKYAWLSRDSAVCHEYENNRLNNFTFTVSGYQDLFILLHQVSDPAWALQVSKNCPILLLSGEEDPVGTKGEGVRQVYNWLKKAGCQAEMKLYSGGRHEILNETNKQEVYEDILGFICKL